MPDNIRPVDSSLIDGFNSIFSGPGVPFRYFNKDGDNGDTVLEYRQIEDQSGKQRKWVVSALPIPPGFRDSGVPHQAAVGIDCSNTLYFSALAAGYNVERATTSQFTAGDSIATKYYDKVNGASLQIGDVLILSGGHAAIYNGDGVILDSGSSAGPGAHNLASYKKTIVGVFRPKESAKDPLAAKAKLTNILNSQQINIQKWNSSDQVFKLRIGKQLTDAASVEGLSSDIAAFQSPILRIASSEDDPAVLQSALDSVIANQQAHDACTAALTGSTATVASVVAFDVGITVTTDDGAQTTVFSNGKWQKASIDETGRLAVTNSEGTSESLPYQQGDFIDTRIFGAVSTASADSLTSEGSATAIWDASQSVYVDSGGATYDATKTLIGYGTAPLPGEPPAPSTTTFVGGPTLTTAEYVSAFSALTQACPELYADQINSILASTNVSAQRTHGKRLGTAH